MIRSYEDIIGIGIRNIDNASGLNTDFFLNTIKHDIIVPCKTYFKGPIVIGGAAVGISGEEMLHFFDIFFGLRGDGEKNMTEFLFRYGNDIPLDGLPGLIRRDNGKIIDNNPPDFVDNLDILPFSKEITRFLNIKRYHRSHKVYIPIQTKRGCPLNCIYCTYNRVEGRYFRLRDPQSVADEIEHLVGQTGIHDFEIIDSVFNIPIDHTKAVLKAIIEKKLIPI